MDSYLAWFALGAFLIIIEVMAPGFWIIWFAIPALITGFISMFVTLSFLGQVIVFSCFAFITLVLLFVINRKLYPARLKDKLIQNTLNQRGIEYLQQSYILETPVVNGQGRLKLGDTYWRIIGPDSPAGTTIILVSMQLNAFVFERVK